MRKTHELRSVKAVSKISHFATMAIIIRRDDLFANFDAAFQFHSIYSDSSNLHALVWKKTKHLSYFYTKES